MTARPIVIFGEPVLRQPGLPVERFDAELGELLDDMIATMRAAPGAGLAAHQIGVPLQLCVMEVGGHVYEVANPRIHSVSDDEEEAWEGCLSLPTYRALRWRSTRAVMTGQDRTGRKIRLAGRGELARAIQHEYDHLQGVLYTDALPDGAEIITEDELDARLRPRRARAGAG